MSTKVYVSHLGDHDNPKGGHRLDAPTEEHRGYDLPFIEIFAADLEEATKFVRYLNGLADRSRMDVFDLVNLIYRINDHVRQCIK